MSKQYKHVIFDFDGVLCDSFKLAAQKFNEIRLNRFPQLPEVQTSEDFDLVYAGPLKHALDKWITNEGTKEFFNLHSEAMRNEVNRLEPYQGITPMLIGLGSKNFSIVTSAYSEAVNAILAKDVRYNESLVHKIAGREFQQPKTLKINGILKDLGLNSDEAVYVGDLESDILYCRDVPIDIVSVGYGYQTLEYLKTKKPTYLVASVQELSEILNELLIK